MTARLESFCILVALIRYDFFMSQQTPFSRLRELDIRDAWNLEAFEFTPWLANNLDYLSEALNIPLELVQREASVGPYSADLLLKNLRDDTPVLVENQLEVSDHTHLGQILTYLQGLQARTVVWVAPRFKDEHLSAIRWLNVNTKQEYSFFAIRIKAVRIDESPIAPVFEVLERPNDWERSIQHVAQAEMTEQGLLRQEFWQHYLNMYLDEAIHGAANAANSRWHTLEDCGLIIGHFLTPSRMGIYVRGLRNADEEEVYNRLLPHRETLENCTGARLLPRRGGRYLLTVRDEEIGNRSKWNELAQWLHQLDGCYVQALRGLFGSN